jgi:hypothetical protein
VFTPIDKPASVCYNWRLQTLVFKKFENKSSNRAYSPRANFEYLSIQKSLQT